MILLDIIESLPVDDPAQAMAREWAQRVRELQRRQSELVEKRQALLDAGDIEGYDAAVDESLKVSAELMTVCHRQMEVLSRMRKSVETMQ